MQRQSPIRQRLAALALLGLAISLQACSGAPHAEGTARLVSTPTPLAETGIPFTEAAVSAGADGAPVVRWAAPGVRKVTLFAGTDTRVSANRRRVGAGGPTGSVVFGPLPAADRWYIELVPDRGVPVVIAEHGLRVANAPNLRDLGGYRTSGGQWVRTGLLFRSDQLDRLDDSELHRLQRSGITLVADLRTASERSREPDRVPPGADHLILDVMASSANAMGGDMQSAMQTIAAGKGAEFLTDANRDFVSAPSALESYGALFARLAAEPGATLYHCTAGKDRTGWASAVLLTLLGVPRETVIADYLASNEYLAAKNEAIYARAGQRPGGLTRAQLEPVMTVRRAYIEAAFSEVEARYGSFDNYRRVGLGIDDDELRALQARFLAGAPTHARDEGAR